VQIKKDQSVGGIEGIDDFFLTHGWLAGRAGETLEANFEDWCAAQMAKKPGLQADYTELMRRSKGWQNLYHPNLKFLLPKDANGNWTTTDPFSGQGWVEANSWQATWFTSHDVTKLVQLMEFVIVAKNKSAANMYIQSATLNGQPLDNCWFYHSQFAAGGKLELTLGPQPNMSWGVKLPPSDSNPVNSSM